MVVEVAAGASAAASAAAFGTVASDAVAYLTLPSWVEGEEQGGALELHPRPLLPPPTCAASLLAVLVRASHRPELRPCPQ